MHHIWPAPAEAGTEADAQPCRVAPAEAEAQPCRRFGANAAAEAEAQPGMFGANGHAQVCNLVVVRGHGVRLTGSAAV